MIAHDKSLHALGGSLMGAIGALVAYWAGSPEWLGAFALAAAVGAGKEVFDLVSRRGTPCWMDAWATVAGALPVALVCAVLVA